MSSPLQLPPLALECPPGYGFVAAALRRFPEDYLGRLLVWDPPRAKHMYVVSVDVGGGIGKDRSVIDVTRRATIMEPAEQAAQFVSDEIMPEDLAPVISAIGTLYAGADPMRTAVVAIEINGFGIACQTELLRHWGYDNLFVWQHWDKPVELSESRSFGWQTTSRTRPLMLSTYVKKIKGDPKTGEPDYRINSPFTINELRTFYIPQGGTLADAAAFGADHDDCIMAGAIGLQVASLLDYDTNEPIDVTRRRHLEEKSRRETAGQQEGRDYQNTDSTLEEMELGVIGPGDGSIVFGTPGEVGGHGGGFGWFGGEGSGGGE